MSNLERQFDLCEVDPGYAVLRAVAKYYGLHIADILSYKRTSTVAWARHLVVYILRNDEFMAWKTIERFLLRERGQAKRSFNVAKSMLEVYPARRNELAVIRKKL